MSKQISISTVLQDMQDGVTRKEMEEKYNINTREVKALFQHPKLKGKKAKKVFKPSFEIIDDTNENATDPVEPTVEEVTESEDTTDFQ